MKKLILTIMGPVVLVGSIVIGVIWWDRGAPPGFRPPVVDVALSEISHDDRGVRVEGTAHYELRIQQELGDTTYILYPLMERGDTTGRTIRAMVRTAQVPDRLLSYEDVTVEGLCRPPGRLVSRSVIEALLARGYDFEEDFVLILAFDD